MPGARRYTGQLREQNQRTPRELSLAARPGIEFAKSPPREMRHSRRRCLPKPVAGVEWAGAAAVEDTELKKLVRRTSPSVSQSGYGGNIALALCVSTKNAESPRICVGAQTRMKLHPRYRLRAKVHMLRAQRERVVILHPHAPCRSRIFRN